MSIATHVAPVTIFLSWPTTEKFDFGSADGPCGSLSYGEENSQGVHFTELALLVCGMIRPGVSDSSLFFSLPLDFVLICFPCAQIEVVDSYPIPFSVKESGKSPGTNSALISPQAKRVIQDAFDKLFMGLVEAGSKTFIFRGGDVWKDFFIPCLGRLKLDSETFSLPAIRMRNGAFVDGHHLAFTFVWKLGTSRELASVVIHQHHPSAVLYATRAQLRKLVRYCCASEGSCIDSRDHM